MPHTNKIVLQTALQVSLNSEIKTQQLQIARGKRLMVELKAIVQTSSKVMIQCHSMAPLDQQMLPGKKMSAYVLHHTILTCLLELYTRHSDNDLTSAEKSLLLSLLEMEDNFSG